MNVNQLTMHAWTFLPYVLKFATTRDRWTWTATSMGGNMHKENLYLMIWIENQVNNFPRDESVIAVVLWLSSGESLKSKKATNYTKNQK